MVSVNSQSTSLKPDRLVFEKSQLGNWQYSYTPASGATFSLRNELIINLRFWLDFFAASLVKKPRDSATIPTFFALLATKISNPKFLIY